jgi:hypothetical protein
MSSGYAIKFEMCANPWRAGLIIFDDGQAKLNRHLISPGRPVLVQLEGLVLNSEQIEACRLLWARLYEAMEFRVASFCPALLPHSQTIMAPTTLVEIPA